MLCCGMPGAGQSATLQRTTNDKFGKLDRVSSQVAGRYKYRRAGPSQTFGWMGHVALKRQTARIESLHFFLKNFGMSSPTFV